MFIFSKLFLGLLFFKTYGTESTTPLIKVIHKGGDHYEGPHWSVAENALYWVDISGQKVLRLDGLTNNVTSRDIGYGPVSLVVTIKDLPGMVAVTSRSELFLLKWGARGGDSALRLLSAVDLGHPDNRCNDGKVDAKGRLWFGTMGPEVNEQVVPDQGTLYKLTQDNYVNPEVEVRPVSVSNGIAWTSDYKYMFYIDTPTKNIEVFDYNLENGSIRNGRTLFSFQANNVTGLPDGMTIDTDDNLWVACYNGGKVIKIDSRAGKLLEQHNLPATKVTSVMFGGHDLSTLYVTTSKRGLTDAELAKQQEAGFLFGIMNTGARGRPENQLIFADAAQY